MKVYLTGDTHGQLEFDRLVKFTSSHSELTKEDYIIVLGDCLGIMETTEGYLDTIKKYSSLNCTILFIDGNHENFPYLNSLEVKEFKGGKCHYVSDSVIHLIRGEVFDFGKFNILAFGGADSFDKKERLEQGLPWFIEETPTLKDLKNGLANLSKHNNKVDYVISHDAPSSSFLYQPERISFSTKILDKIDAVVDCKKWYFGHYHHDMDVNGNKRILYKKFERIY